MYYKNTKYKQKGVKMALWDRVKEVGEKVVDREVYHTKQDVYRGASSASRGIVGDIGNWLVDGINGLFGTNINHVPGSDVYNARSGRGTPHILNANQFLSKENQEAAKRMAGTAGQSFGGGGILTRLIEGIGGALKGIFSKIGEAFGLTEQTVKTGVEKVKTGVERVVETKEPGGYNPNAPQNKPKESMIPKGEMDKITSGYINLVEGTAGNAPLSEAQHKLLDKALLSADSQEKRMENWKKFTSTLTDDGQKKLAEEMKNGAPGFFNNPNLSTHLSYDDMKTKGISAEEAGFKNAKTPAPVEEKSFNAPSANDVNYHANAQSKREELMGKIQTQWGAASTGAEIEQVAKFGQGVGLDAEATANDGQFKQLANQGARGLTGWS